MKMFNDEFMGDEDRYAKDEYPYYEVKRYNQKYLNNLASEEVKYTENDIYVGNHPDINDVNAPVSNNYEMVNHPKYYGGKDNPYEAIKVIEAWDLNFNLGSALKYISRKSKPDASLDEQHKRLEDLKKAAWYVNREVERFEKEINKNS